MGKPQNYRQALSLLLATFFYLGYLPLIPGTFASLSGIGIFLVLKNNPLFYVVATFAITIIGLYVSGRAEKLIGRKDPCCIVIDEVSGMLIALAFIPGTLQNIIIAFFIFRLLDTVKPYPLGWLQRLDAGAGIMADDIVAGLYTNITLQAALRLASFIIS